MAARLQKLASKSGATQNEFMDVFESVLKSKDTKNLGETLKSYIDAGKSSCYSTLDSTGLNIFNCQLFSRHWS